MNTSDIFDQVQKNIDGLASSNVSWSVPVTHEQINQFIDGDWSSLQCFLPPKDWVFNDLEKRKVLCLAGAGGQQAPLFAAAGAEVTVFDLSENMLQKDRLVAERENLSLQIEQGTMCDLSRFSDDSFDIIINPPSLMYVPDVFPVFRECHRILKPDGVFIMCAPNPINYICEYEALTNRYIACNQLPYQSFEHDDQGDWIEYGHTLESYIGGQIKAGFCITGFYENRQNNSIETDFVTRAVKLQPKPFR